MWTKYGRNSYGEILYPSSNPENPTSLDKLAALVRLAKKQHEEKRKEIINAAIRSYSYKSIR